MSDPRDPYNEFPNKRPTYDDLTTRQFAPWGWIAGGVIIVLLLLVFAFGTGSDGERSATNVPPATTTTPPASTGQAPSENTGEAPASRPAPPPAADPPPVRNVTPEPPAPPQQ